MRRRQEKRLSSASAGGFTLAELLIVAVLVSIFVAVLVSPVLGSTNDAQAASAARSVRAVQAGIDRHHAQEGAYPATLDSAWFRNYKLPSSPYSSGDFDDVVNVQDISGKVHPTHKSDISHNSTYWYNRNNGRVRIRVIYQGNQADTLALYNAVNHTNAVTWDQQGPTAP